MAHGLPSSRTSCCSGVLNHFRRVWTCNSFLECAGVVSTDVRKPSECLRYMHVSRMAFRGPHLCLSQSHNQTRVVGGKVRNGCLGRLGNSLRGFGSMLGTGFDDSGVFGPTLATISLSATLPSLPCLGREQTRTGLTGYVGLWRIPGTLFLFVFK